MSPYEFSKRTFDSPIDGANASVTANPGVHDQYRTNSIVLPQALWHALGEEGRDDGVRLERVVGRQHVVFATGNVKFHLVAVVVGAGSPGKYREGGEVMY